MENKEINDLLDELLAPRYSQAPAADIKNEAVEIYHNGHAVGTPFVLPWSDGDHDEEDEDS